MPTGAPARRDVFEKLVAFARSKGILLVNDNPYSFILNEPQSILAIPGAKECCLEMNSLSKSHNMAGWRVGMMLGSAEILQELLKVKTQMDSGMFRGIQEAAAEALKVGPEWYEAGGLYVWGCVPSGTAEEWSDRILYEAGVFLTPGFVFGSNGAHYLRISLCSNIETLNKALIKICAL